MALKNAYWKDEHAKFITIKNWQTDKQINWETDILKTVTAEYITFTFDENNMFNL